MEKLTGLKEVGKVRFYSAMKGAQNKCLTVKGNAEGQADIILKAG